MVQNGPKWSKVVKNGQNGQKWSKMVGLTLSGPDVPERPPARVGARRAPRLLVFYICHRHHRTTVEKKWQIWGLGFGVVSYGRRPPPLSSIKYLSTSVKMTRLPQMGDMSDLASFQGFRFDQKAPSEALQHTHTCSRQSFMFTLCQNRLPCIISNHLHVGLTPKYQFYLLP